MIDAARMARRFLAVNLIMRYDPLNQAVARISRSRPARRTAACVL
jgi:hypothetical protein